MAQPRELATFAGGCFWCVEAAFEEVEGVTDVTSGYCGGDVPEPSYEAVCTGSTGHAEAVQVEYDPERISYDDLLAIFFTIHDPTTRDRQGPDVGSQYRSAIFYHDEDQRGSAAAFIEALEAEDVYEDPIVTELAALDTFYEAEASHQDYFEKVKSGAGNTNDAYCYRYIPPKLEKIREEFPDAVRAED